MKLRFSLKYTLLFGAFDFIGHHANFTKFNFYQNLTSEINLKVNTEFKISFKIFVKIFFIVWCIKISKMLKFDFIFQITLTIFSTAWRDISYMYRWDTYLLNDTRFPLYTGMWRNLRRNSTPHILWYSFMYWCNLIKISPHGEWDERANSN